GGRPPGPADAARHPPREQGRKLAPPGAPATTAGTAQSAALARISDQVTNAGSDLEPVLMAVAERLADLIGPFVVIRIMTEDGQRLEHTLVYHPRPLMRAALEQVCLVDHPDPPALARHVVHTGETMRLSGTDMNPWLVDH